MTLSESPWASNPKSIQSNTSWLGLAPSVLNSNNVDQIPDEVFEQFLWLLVKYDCSYALLLIAERAHQAGVPAKDWLRAIVEKELAKGEARPMLKNH